MNRNPLALLAVSSLFLSWTSGIAHAQSPSPASSPPQGAKLPDSAATIPGVVIDYLPATTDQYLGSPSLAVLPNGDYVVSHDFFGTKATNQLSAIFTSKDRGKTWQHLTDLDGQWWSGLFVHRGVLYIMGVRNWLGDVIIRRSSDGGKTWTDPVNAESGLLLAGRYHTSAVPIVVHDGRIWRAMEEWNPKTIDKTAAFLMSAPENSDLLQAKNWTVSSALPSPDGYNNWREGNAVATPEGKMVDFIRVHIAKDKASILRLSDDGKTLTYDPARDLIDFPGGSTKFTIRFDAKTGLYWALVNKQTNPSANRNRLVLISSKDLIHWDTKATLLEHPDREGHAFEYVDWLFDGEDIIAVSRTAWDGAHSAHDSNYITFHRFPRVRTL